MKVFQSQFEIGGSHMLHKPTGALFTFIPYEPVFAAVAWSNGEDEPRVKGFIKREVWAAAQNILQRIAVRKAG